MVDSFEDKVQLYFAEERLILQSQLIIMSNPFYMDPFGRWLGEERQCVTFQNRPLIGYQCRHFHSPKHYLIWSQVQAFPHIVMKLFTHRDQLKSAPSLSNGYYIVNLLKLSGLSLNP